MIVKCQCSLSNNVGYPTMLFYDQDRARLGEYEMVEPWTHHFKVNGPKFFAEVQWPDSVKVPVFVKTVDYQPW